MLFKSTFKKIQIVSLFSNDGNILTDMPDKFRTTSKPLETIYSFRWGLIQQLKYHTWALILFFYTFHVEDPSYSRLPKKGQKRSPGPQIHLLIAKNILFSSTIPQPYSHCPDWATVPVMNQSSLDNYMYY